MSEVNGVQVPPRTCRTILRGHGPGGTPRFNWKAVFATEAEALAFGARNGTPVAYECPNCWYWHRTKMSRERWAELQDLRAEQAL